MNPSNMTIDELAKTCIESPDPHAQELGRRILDNHLIEYMGRDSSGLIASFFQNLHMFDITLRDVIEAIHQGKI
jgi:hypothetical protein